MSVRGLWQTVAPSVNNSTSKLFFLALTLTWVRVHYRSRLNKIGQGLSAKTAIMWQRSTLSSSSLLSTEWRSHSEPSDGLQSPSQGIMSLINQTTMFCTMNYSSDLHFVSKNGRRGLARSEDHDEEDSDEEESQDCAHHGSGNHDGVWPLCLGLVWGRVETLSVQH